MRYLIALTLLCSLTAHAEVFMCEENGHKIFSQQPCGRNAQSLTLDNEVQKITIPDEIDEEYARNICTLAAKAWDKATVTNRSAYDSTTYQERAAIEGIHRYIRDRIANYGQVARRNPYLETSVAAVSRSLWMLARAVPNPTADQIGEFTDGCGKTVMESAARLYGKDKKDKGAPGKAAPGLRSTRSLPGTY
ncbi:hypothetical protein EV700_2296 [Fluviicoccus keumensis]|uniref:DUF4124 domain-containing protein n=1 Tax=Fluviicoccus keumensis TaxID=1435465 RepID=A0A4Q7YNW5_9GAMM|nr:DUF4124 domain-containing protein [Fluviicoccus keumensis]RZU38365.1 hypothetical protein EV700_2296 [Fluviicoccus keumensis]